MSEPLRKKRMSEPLTKMIPLIPLKKKKIELKRWSEPLTKMIPLRRKYSPIAGLPITMSAE
jgi:hypothetical protein